MCNTIISKSSMLMISRSQTQSHHRQYSRMGQKILEFYSKLWPAKPAQNPPYKHVCQIGDPILRAAASEVDINTIRSIEVQKVVQALVGVLRKTGAVGLSAPQIGVRRRIFVMQFTKHHMQNYTTAMQEQLEIYLVPLKVFINPKINVKDTSQASFNEGCLSVCGYSAQVPRFLEVEISGKQTVLVFFLP